MTIRHTALRSDLIDAKPSIIVAEGDQTGKLRSERKASLEDRLQPGCYRLSKNPTKVDTLGGQLPTILVKVSELANKGSFGRFGAPVLHELGKKEGDGDH